MGLLEREGPLAVLADAHAAAAAGQGSAVLVSGEPGIGKTSLVTAFVSGLGPQARALVGSCDDLSVPRPFGPFHDLAERGAPRTCSTLRSGGVPHAVHRALLDDLGSPPSPVVLVVEDVHWADEATLDAITVVGRRIAELPAVLVLTYRDGEVDPGHPLHATLGSLRVEPARHLRLEPLSPAAVAALAGDDGERLHALTGGNPFFVTELLAGRPADLPPSVANAVVGRAARLGDDARSVVELVAMVPSRMPVAVLDAVLPGWPAAAEEPERRQLLQVGPREVRFRHELARAAIRSSVPAARRRALHRRILDALLARGAPAADVVHHANEAGADDVVAEHALVAAREAAAAGSNREAHAHYRRAADFADRLPVGERASLYEELATSAYMVDRLDDSSAAIERAIELHGAAGDEHGHGRCVRLRSRFHWYAGDGEAAHRDGRLAVDLLEPLGPSVELAQAYSGLSQLAMLASDEAGAVRWATRALELNERLGDDRIRAHALINIGITRTTHDPDDVAALLEAFEVADRAGERHEAVRALVGIVWGHLTWVRPVEAKRYAATAIDYARRHQVDQLLAYLEVTDAWLRLRAGDAATAEAVAAREAHRGTTVSQLLAATVLAELAVRRGDDDARARLDDVGAAAERTGELQRFGPVLELEVEWALTRGEPLPRERLAAVLGSLAPDQLAAPGGARLLAWAAVAGLDVEARGGLPAPHAAMLAGDLAAAADAFGAAGWRHDRALLLSLLDDRDALREALAIARELGAAPLAGRVAARMRALRLPVPRGPVPATRANPAGLTARQLEVLALLAEGLTNADIAARLVISERTAEHHVEAILAKLGVRTRRDAARCYAAWTRAGAPLSS